MKSFHDTYIAKTVTVKIPGIARGIRTVKRILKSLDPSKIATSLKDLGILLKAFLIIKIPRGTIDMECKKINEKINGRELADLKKREIHEILNLFIKRYQLL